MKMNRRFVNLVLRNWAEGVYSLRRIDPYKHLFYQSTKEAEEVAAKAIKKESTPMMQALRLPDPIVSFAPSPTGQLNKGSMDLFALLGPRSSGGDGRVVSANMAGDAVLYDADKHLFLTLPYLNEPKGMNPACFSIAHPATEEDDLYVMDRYPEAVARPGRPASCFEVLEYMPRCSELSDSMKGWRWRLLPPPPFVHLPGYEPSLITSYTTMVDANGCSTICISCDREGTGTYCFDTVCLDSTRLLGWRHSEEWRHVGDWVLPFDGRAQYVHEFNLWFGFSACSPNHLCAVDLSAMDHAKQPTAQHVWQDMNPPEGEEWIPTRLWLLYLGDGRFCVAKSFIADATGERFAVLAGVEMVRSDDDNRSLWMVKHKCTRYTFASDVIECVI